MSLRATSRHLRGQPFALRLLATAAALVALGGTVELHPGAHGRAGGDDLVYTCADGSGGALHVEAARAEEREHCPACLQRLQSRASGTAAPAAPGDRVAERVAPADPDPALSPAHPRRQRSRAPPALS
jgi:hypothetical protein